jgi:hypothetical protein
MPHTVFTRDAGGGIYSRNVPENFIDFGAFPYALTQSSFQRCLVASLNTTSTAVRAANVVTITSTAHGIPNTYNGFRFYYPGSPTLAAGWVDNITVTGANTITFPSIGADFGSESINAAAAYTTATNIPGGILIPAGMVSDSSSIRLTAHTASINTAATKTVRPFLGASAIAPAQSGTTFNCMLKEWEFCMLNTTQIVGHLVASGNLGSGSISSGIAFNTLADNLILTQLTVSAAQDFIALLQAPKIILFR